MMGLIKIANPVFWREAKPSLYGLIHNYDDIIEERKYWNTLIEDQKKRADEYEKRCEAWYDEAHKEKKRADRLQADLLLKGMDYENEKKRADELESEINRLQKKIATYDFHYQRGMTKDTTLKDLASRFIVSNGEHIAQEEYSKQMDKIKELVKPHTFKLICGIEKLYFAEQQRVEKAEAKLKTLDEANTDLCIDNASMHTRFEKVREWIKEQDKKTLKAHDLPINSRWMVAEHKPNLDELTQIIGDDSDD